jgi:hypothetical protein
MTPKDAFYKVGTGIHRVIFNVSKGRIFGKAFGMPLIELVTTILLSKHKHGRAKVAHYFGREWRPKGRVGESLEYSDPAAHTKIALHHGRSLWNTSTKIL